METFYVDLVTIMKGSEIITFVFVGPQPTSLDIHNCDIFLLNSTI